MKRKAVAAVLTAVMVASMFTGCGSDNGSSSAKSASAASAASAANDTVDEDGKKILYRDGDAVYLSLALIQKYTDVRLQAYDGEAQKRVFVENNWDPVTVADAAWSAKIRLRGGLKSPIVTEIKRGGTVTVLEQYDNWARVMTPDGHLSLIHI